MPLTDRRAHHDATLASSAVKVDDRPTLVSNDIDTAGVQPSTSTRTVALLRIAFGLVWAVDAVLKWLPGFRDGFAAMLDDASRGQPGWLQPWFDLWTGLSHGEVSALAYLSAITETFLAVALLAGFARKSTYLIGAGYSVMVWATGEGFGGPYRSGSTDVGAALIYAIVFAALFVIDRAGPDPYSIDSHLEQRVSWWHRIAEVAAIEGDD
jgi:nitrite reductase (NO-forming)